ncbi:hypothetical protein C3L33_19544, partial [Rhododendron williamsianum]
MSYVHASSPLTSPSKINVDHSNMLNSNPPSSGMLSAAFDGSLYTCMHHLQFNEKLVVGTRNGSLSLVPFNGTVRADSLMFREIKNFISRRLNLEPHEEGCVHNGSNRHRKNPALSRSQPGLAAHFPAEIINSDKIQVYKGLDIVTNKVSEMDRRGVAHHLLGEVDPEKATIILPLELEEMLLHQCFNSLVDLDFVGVDDLSREMGGEIKREPGFSSAGCSHYEHNLLLVECMRVDDMEIHG